jgi:WD40 repeat protein
LDDSKILTTGGDNLVKVFNAQTGEKLLSLDMHKSTVLTAVFHPLNEYIYSAGTDDWIGIWNNLG